MAWQTQFELFDNYIDMLIESGSDWIYGDSIFDYHTLDKRVMIAFLIWAEYIRTHKK